MLYDRWEQVLSKRRGDWALFEPASGRRWTFQQLSDAAGVYGLSSEPFACPQGMKGEFILQVLCAWRVGRVVMPLESGQARPKFPLPPPRCIHLKTTSASTGPPRAIAFTATQLSADADQIVSTMGLLPESPNLAVISLAHSYGFSNLVLPLLLHGIPLILLESPLPEMVSKAIRDHPGLTLPAVPALWRTWNESRILDDKIRLGISAGAPLPLKLEQQIHSDCGLKIHNFYGASECGGIAYDRSNSPRIDASYVGTPLDNVAVHVGMEGRLEIVSRAVGESYWPEPHEDLGRGEFKSGDLADIQEGKIYLKGRWSDLINVAGRKFAPEVVENALLRHPKVKGAVVFGVSEEPTRADQVVACLEAPGVQIQELRDFLLSQCLIPAWQLPREWWMVEKLDANQRGKISRVEWRQRFLERPKN